MTSESFNDINPREYQLLIGRKIPRKITIYPFSLRDQLAFVDLVLATFSNIVDSGATMENINFVQIIVESIRNNIEKVLGMSAPDEEVYALMDDMTLPQLVELIDMVYDINFAPVTKNLPGLLEKFKKLLPSERSLQESVKPTDNTD